MKLFVIYESSCGDAKTSFVKSFCITDIKRHLLLSKFVPNPYYCSRFGLKENDTNKLGSLSKFLQSSTKDIITFPLFSYAFTGGFGDQDDPGKEWHTIDIKDFDDLDVQIFNPL